MYVNTCICTNTYAQNVNLVSKGVLFATKRTWGRKPNCMYVYTCICMNTYAKNVNLVSKGVRSSDKKKLGVNGLRPSGSRSKRS